MSVSELYTAAVSSPLLQAVRAMNEIRTGH